MKKIKWLFACSLMLSLTSCGSLEQWANGLQAIGNSMTGTAAAYGGGMNNGYTGTVTASSGSSAKEWHNCSSCAGSGKCKFCDGSGRYSYSKDGKCHSCARSGTGKCAGCDGKGGWYI